MFTAEFSPFAFFEVGRFDRKICVNQVDYIITDTTTTDVRPCSFI